MTMESQARIAEETGAAIEVAGVACWCDPSGALYLPESRTLVVSDLHLEKGAAFARRGSLLPPYDTLATLRLLTLAVHRLDPKVILSLGDNFHDRVGAALMPEPFREMIRALAKGREFLWINGNHDPDGVADLPGDCADEIVWQGLTFRHEPQKGAKAEIAGHLHPAATVVRREKRVRRPCFASDGQRLIMPSFGVMTGGLDLRHKAMTGLFDRKQLTAHILGRDRIYSVAFGNLIG